MDKVKDGDTIVVWFSCGAASAVAAWLTLRCYGHRCNVRIVNNYIKHEDADNRRFLADVERWLGMTFERAESSKYPSGDCVVVWDDRQYMSGTKGAPCTTWLKKKARQEFEDRNPHEWIVMGFTAYAYSHEPGEGSSGRSGPVTPVKKRRERHLKFADVGFKEASGS